MPSGVLIKKNQRYRFVKKGILKSALGLIFILKNTSKLLSCNQNNLNHLCFYHAELIVT